jgi:hypothetical protein
MRDVRRFLSVMVLYCPVALSGCSSSSNGGDGGPGGGGCHRQQSSFVLTGAVDADVVGAGQGVTETSPTTITLFNVQGISGQVSFEFYFPIDGLPSVGQQSCSPSRGCFVTIDNNANSAVYSAAIYNAHGVDAGVISFSISSVANYPTGDGGPSDLWCVDAEITAIAPPQPGYPGTGSVSVDGGLVYE